MLDILFLAFVIGVNQPNDSFVMPIATTYPEERYVQEAHPVLPVDIEVLQ